MDEPIQNISQSLLLPSFLQSLASPEVKNVFITGCGGGFDFCHGMLLYPELKRLGKNITIGSFSFGSPANINDSEVIFSEKTPGGICEVKKVFGGVSGSWRYCPEIRMAEYLDEKYPDCSPHFVYAYNARLFSVPLLTKLYTQFIKEHNIDTIIVIDGGSDSLMKGDEDGLGDPIEDCVSVTTAALLPGLKLRLVLSVGMGMDRFNGVSDADSLRAVAEITELGGFLGSLSIEKDSTPFQFYKGCIDFINGGQSFRSVMSTGLIASTEGHFGFKVPDAIKSRVGDGNLYLWPLMGMIWAFDPKVMAQRSLTSKWIVNCEHYIECFDELCKNRKILQETGLLRPVGNIPTQDDIMKTRFTDPGNDRDVKLQKEEDEEEEELNQRYQILSTLGWIAASSLVIGGSLVALFKFRPSEQINVE